MKKFLYLICLLFLKNIYSIELYSLKGETFYDFHLTYKNELLKIYMKSDKYFVNLKIDCCQEIKFFNNSDFVDFKINEYHFKLEEQFLHITKGDDKQSIKLPSCINKINDCIVSKNSIKIQIPKDLPVMEED